MLLTFLWATVTLSSGDEADSSSFETVRNSNAAILNRLGLVPLRIPDGHHKKRLAGPEPSAHVSSVSQTRIHQPYSRRHGHRDSHVYIVKLPASQPYYTLTKPHKPSSPLEKDKITKTTRITASDGSAPQVGFHSNGKPGKIYHWNIPIVKKITEKKRLRSQSRLDQIRRKIEAEMNERQKQHEHRTRLRDETPDTMNTMLADTSVRRANLPAAGKPVRQQPNVKRYHHSPSGNSLSDDEKPAKHTRNNDKRLSYPRIADEAAEALARPEVTPKNATSAKKAYRLEDSSLYRLGATGQQSGDRHAGWPLDEELHASRNTPSGQKAKKHRKKAAMSYYAPINSSKIDDNGSVKNKFSGNGKPKGFYVMEKSRKPVYYHPLLP